MVCASTAINFRHSDLRLQRACHRLVSVRNIERQKQHATVPFCFNFTHEIYILCQTEFSCVEISRAKSNRKMRSAVEKEISDWRVCEREKMGRTFFNVAKEWRKSSFSGIIYVEIFISRASLPSLFFTFSFTLSLFLSRSPSLTLSISLCSSSPFIPAASSQFPPTDFIRHSFISVCSASKCH